MRIKLAVAGVILAVICVAVCLRYVDKTAIRSLPAYWSMTGEAPWGTAARDETGRIPVVFWQPTAGGYYYDAVFSDDLRKRLGALQATTVVVDYRVFSDFGRPRRRTIRAVNGIPVDNSSRQDSGMMEEPQNNRSRKPAADCEERLANHGNNPVPVSVRMARIEALPKIVRAGERRPGSLWILAT